MHTPTKAQMQTVIDNLERVLPYAKHKGHLDMMESLVNGDGHLCGTTHCFGGWYAVATLNIGRNDYINYSDGANLMAVHLGFFDKCELMNWAIHNPEIWGNEDGEYMFNSRNAFNGAKSLAEIVEYLKGVHDRLPK